MNPVVPPSGSANAVKHRVYDLSIKDLEKRKKKSMLFESGEATVNYLGMSRNSLSKYCVVGKRYYSLKHGKEFAIRVVNEK